MKSSLPPLRSIQAFEAFGRVGSVAGAAKELNVTAGAISQQIKILEEQLGMTLILKDGRRTSLTQDAKIYHEIVSAGFDKLRSAHRMMSQKKNNSDIVVSGLPTLLIKWLNPRIPNFRNTKIDVTIRLEAVHREPEPQQLHHIFRLTYGAFAGSFAHSRQLFTDICFPVCSPEFLKQNPEAAKPDHMGKMPWIDIDWGPEYASAPKLKDWMEHHQFGRLEHKASSTHSLSSLALECAADGQGITLAQSAFASKDIEFGRLVKLSDKYIQMPESYYVCWGDSALERDHTRPFLNWILEEARLQSNQYPNPE